MWKAQDSGCIWGEKQWKHEKGLQSDFDEFEKLTLKAFPIQGRNLLRVLTHKQASNSSGLQDPKHFSLLGKGVSAHWL